MIIIYNVVMIFCLLFSLYFALTGLFAFKKVEYKNKTNRKHKFAILIPCRNEEEVISSLIESIYAQSYSKKCYDCFVIPNNCTDETEKIAREKQAKIIKLEKATKSKGEVLKYTFEYLKDKNYDAYVIFDADNIAHKDFLYHMNKSLNEGYLVVQGFRDAKNPSDNYLTGSYTMFYYLQNFFYNKSRMALKRSAAINGTGFCVAKEVIDKYGFHVKTLTDDSEFTGICSLNHIQIAFNSKAITYDEHPTNFKTSYRQRKRWSSGSYACLTRYSKSLLKDFWRNANFCSFDCLLYYLAPLFQVISFIFPLIMIIYNLLEGIIMKEVSINISSIIFFLFFYLCSVLLNIFIIKMLHKKIKDHYKGIFGFSYFILTWLPINIICLFKRTRKWEPIEHRRKISISNIFN